MGHHRADTRASRGRQPETPPVPSDHRSPRRPSPADAPPARSTPARARPFHASRSAAPRPRHVVRRRPALRRSARPSSGCCPRRRSCSASPPWPSRPVAPSRRQPGARRRRPPRRPPRSARPAPSSGASGIGSTSLARQRRGPGVSRDSRRDAPADAADDQLQAAAEAQAKRARRRPRRSSTPEAEQQAPSSSLEPVAPARSTGYHLTARFGDYGLWSHYHTGLDFAGPDRHPDPRDRQRRGHLRRLRRLLRQQDRGDPR